MRSDIPLLIAALLFAPAALAQATVTDHVVYLHENPLHALPESINAKLGETIRFTVENPAVDGKTPHNFLLCGDAPKPAESCDERLGFTGMIQPGGNAVVTVPLEKAGTFEYYCYLPGHKGAGMTGTLVVQAESTRGVDGLSPLTLLLAGIGAAFLGRRARR